MIRLSVSDLESYRYWKEREDSTVKDLLARLAHTSPPTPQMEAGRALARVFERANGDDLHIITVDGWTFDFTQLDATLDLAPIREIKAEIEIETPSGPVTLVGKADGLHGLRVRDQKLTERYEAERYLDSLQWRAYLTMFGAREFIYDVFVGRYSGNLVTIYDYERLPFHAYPNMRADVERAVCELAEVVARFVPEAAA